MRLPASFARHLPAAEHSRAASHSPFAVKLLIPLGPLEFLLYKGAKCGDFLSLITSFFSFFEQKTEAAAAAAAILLLALPFFSIHKTSATTGQARKCIGIGSNVAAT